MRVFLLATLVAVAGLAACGEKAQTTSGRKADAKASDGTNDGYAVAGWKAGDHASWEEQMRNRAQTQNEYARAAGAAK